MEAEPRLLLAVEPPAATPQQPVTLAMLQETKYSLFLLCGLARLAGQWRLLLPDALPAFRQATAALLAVLAAPAAIHGAPVAPEERAAAAVAEGPELAEGETPQQPCSRSCAWGWGECRRVLGTASP